MYWTAHHLERIGDRAVNICERVMLEATGHLIYVSQPVVQRWVGHSTP
jgi:phosphate uptake regulator